MSPISFTLNLSGGEDGKLHAEISPPGDEARFHVPRALLVLRVWRESADIVRCAIHHPSSNVTAYLQGNEGIEDLFQTLHLEFK